VIHNVGYYMRLPYAVKVVPKEDGYFAEVEDLPGCTAWANNLEGLWPAVGQAKRAWLEEALQKEKHIPEPGEGEESLKEYSGRMLLRMPRSLHRDLAGRARLEGVSLNQFIVTALARAVGLNDSR
jgi:antitoxin HicB